MRPIDADALMDEIAVLLERNEESIDGWLAGAIDDTIEQAPAIDAVKVVRGEWIHNPQIGWGETWECSICGEKTTSSIMGKPRYKFCPMCGARMKGADDELFSQTKGRVGHHRKTAQ